MKPDRIWSDTMLQDPHRCPDKARRVREMFNLIAARYDLANTIISFGLAQYARRRLIKHLKKSRKEPAAILDLCAGPATLTRVLAKNFQTPDLLAVDFAFNMLKTAQRRNLSGRIMLACADAMNLPFPDDIFDVVTCVYGLRNFQDLRQGLTEIHRVLKPGGQLAALDFQLPSNPIFRPVYKFYFNRIMPLIAAAVTGKYRPYKYLPSSVSTWYDEAELLSSLSDVGFTQTRCRRIGQGVIILLTGIK